MDNPNQLGSHLQLESSKFEEAQPLRSKSPSLSPNDDPLMLPFQKLSHLLNLEILSYLDCDQLRSISHLCRIFHSEFLKAKEAREIEIRKAKCNFIHLPFEIWALEIIARMDYDNIKKVEIICTTLRDHVHSYRLLKIQLFRGQVDNKSLLKHYQELELKASQDHEEKDDSEKEKEKKDDGDNSFKHFKANLHPSFATKVLKYHIDREKNNVTSDTFRVSAYGVDDKNVKHYTKKIDWDLEEHQIGSETATEIPVGWFRFDFEEAGKQHRGTSDRYPTTNGKPRAVTIMDVMFTWTQLKGGKNLAEWYKNGSNKKNSKNSALWKEKTMSPATNIQARFVKKGNSVGIEIKSELVW